MSNLVYAELKSKADECYNSKNFGEAVKFYDQALLVDETNSIIINSNLSACHFELGIFKLQLFSLI